MLKENQKIWHYLNLWKFESMLKEEALFFARASVMDDKGEGRVSGMARAVDNLVATNLPNAEGNKFKKQAQWGYDVQDKLKENVFINCWRIDDCESSKAWGEYVKNGKGVVIQTTYDKFIECFCRKDYEVFERLHRKITGDGDPLFPSHYNADILSKTIFVEPIRYHPFGISSLPLWCKCLLHCTYKDANQFGWENELRALIYDEEVNEKWIPIPVDLEVLIEKIIVLPKMPELHSEVKSITAKHGLKIDVRKSSLVG